MEVFGDSWSCIFYRPDALLNDSVKALKVPADESTQPEQDSEVLKSSSDKLPNHTIRSTLILLMKAFKGSTGRMADELDRTAWLFSANVNDTVQWSIYITETKASNY